MREQVFTTKFLQFKSFMVNLSLVDKHGIALSRITSLGYDPDAKTFTIVIPLGKR